jgi:8-oxo-dGTP pyrophosphatase MutT (NUDIX family)
MISMQAYQSFRDYLTWRTHDFAEETMRLELIKFVQGNKEFFQRSLSIGHVTGSVFAVNPSFKFALLIHHMKLNRWLQFGGHSDGDSNTMHVALREASEESGLKSIRLYTSDIFDIDVHPIPERGNEPEHKHYDVRLLHIADPREPFAISNESKELRWVKISDVAQLNPTDAMRRMVEKTKRLE